jgi:armadillo repeat-containing protein 8
LLIQSALSAIAAITLFKDDYRKQVIDTGLIPSIVAAMSSFAPGIRAAACQCTRSLSRSVCILRTNLVDAGIAVPLFRLLSDESLEVKIAATGAVCNLMLEFSPMRRAILEQGAMKILCQHTYSQFAQLRLNAVWALKHFCYQPDEPLQVEQMLQELGYEQLMKLCDDEDVGVQEQALSIIRNVMTGEVKSIGLLFDNIGSARLMRLIVEKLGSAYCEIVGAVRFLFDYAYVQRLHISAYILERERKLKETH